MVTDNGLAVVGTLNTADVTDRVVNGDGKEEGVVESRLTVPVNVAVALK